MVASGWCLSPMSTGLYAMGPGVIEEVFIYSLNPWVNFPPRSLFLNLMISYEPGPGIFFFTFSYVYSVMNFFSLWKENLFFDSEEKIDSSLMYYPGPGFISQSIVFSRSSRPKTTPVFGLLLSGLYVLGEGPYLVSNFRFSRPKEYSFFENFFSLLYLWLKHIYSAGLGVFSLLLLSCLPFIVTAILIYFSLEVTVGFSGL